MDTKTKNSVIKESVKATRERRERMDCHVFIVKALNRKLSKHRKKYLGRYFLEGKWLRNSELSKGDPALFDRNAKTVKIKTGSGFEERELTVLGSQMKQDIVDSLKSEIKGLSTKKSRGEKVGRLKFKSYCNCIPLRQHGVTFKIDFDKNTISIQNMAKYPIRVRGLKQIPKNAEIANAKLVRKIDGYYFHITVYTEPEVKAKTNKVCGIDFGIGDNLVLTTGEKFNVNVSESKSVKLASRKVNRSLHKNHDVKSKNHYRRVGKLQKAYLDQTNKKRDLANKITSYLLKNYDFIAIQDEMIANWHKGLFGKQVQHSAMGSIKSKLKTNSQVHVVGRSFPSTQKCPICGKNTKHPLSMREFRCSYCGYTHPSRDRKAAESILIEAINQVSVERRTQSPVETKTNTLIKTGDESCLNNNSSKQGKSSSMKQEAQVL